MEKKVLDRILQNVKHGTLELTFWDGETRTYGRGTPRSHVTIHKRKALRKIVRSPSLALGEAYMNGDIEIDEPFTDFLKLAEANEVNITGLGSQSRRFRRLHRNKKSTQARLIQHHYDIGNDFYRLWLDPTLTYSCAYFKKRGDSLEQAQRQKIDHILRKLQLKPGMKLLDIGSGWGHLLVTAAKKYKVKGVGVTLSHEQVTFAKRLAKQEGVDKLVTFRLQNYQDLPPAQKFDRIVSVGFFEHVGHDNLDIYFQVVDRLLKPDGISVLHAISGPSESPMDPWIDKYIFPGSYVPSVREVTALLPEHNFYLFDYENLGQHYALTLEQWWRNFERHKKEVIAMYDERFYRMWRLYLAAVMTMFRNSTLVLSQWTFKKGRSPEWPRTREYLYK